MRWKLTPKINIYVHFSHQIIILRSPWQFYDLQSNFKMPPADVNAMTSL